LRERLLVLAKAYPIISKTYEHLVCIAGITETGEWRRIYPVPWEVFWKGKDTKFKKKQWIEYELKSATSSDGRPESRKIDFDTIKPLEEEDFIKIKKLLDERLTSLEELQSKSHTEVSLGVIKPEIKDFVWQKSQSYERTLKMGGQRSLDGKPAVKIETPDKMFQYVFSCSAECTKNHTVMCEDWELGELYRKMKSKYPEKMAVEKVRSRFLDYMKDLGEIYFIVGTHNIYGTYLIISVIYPRKADLQKLKQFVYVRSNLNGIGKI
jgi:hypothetical protein